MDFLQLAGKRFLIFGVANKKSVAYAVSKMLVEEGSECVFVVQNQTILERVSKLFPDSSFFTCNVENEDEIHAFCTAKYKTSFDQLAKIDVNGDNEEPLFAYLKSQRPDEEIEGEKNKAAMQKIAEISVTCKKPGDIKWNFTKFLVDRAGNVAKRFAPTTDPMSFEADIAALI